MKGLDLSFMNPQSLRKTDDYEIEAAAKEEFLSQPHFTLAQTANPAEFLNEAYGASDIARKLDFNKGTTTLSFVYNQGIVVAVDSRATQGGFIASQSVKKVIEINPYLLGTMAGGAADCKFWERELGRVCRLYELRNKERISVSAASKILANILFDYRGYGLSMGTMIVGWDKTGPNLYYVDNDGTRIKNHMFSVGSGSSYAYGVLDSGYRPDLSREEAIELGRRSIYHATFRDAASGGIVNVYHVDQNGWVKISADDMNDLHDRYAAERGTPIRPIETSPIPA